MKDFFAYIKNPTLCEESSINWKLFRNLYLWYFLYVACLSICFFILQKLGLPIEKPVRDNFTYWMGIFIVAIKAPIVEEIFFRLPLKKSNTNTLFLIGALVIYAFSIYYKHGKFEPFNFFVVSFIILYFITILFQKIEIKFKYFFYVSCLIFALLHMTNFSEINYITPLLVLPQLGLGLILGFIRMRYGFFYGILFHALVNLPSALVG